MDYHTSYLCWHMIMDMTSHHEQYWALPCLSWINHDKPIRLHIVQRIRFYIKQDDLPLFTNMAVGKNHVPLVYHPEPLFPHYCALGSPKKITDNNHCWLLWPIIDGIYHWVYNQPLIIMNHWVFPIIDHIKHGSYHSLSLTTDHWWLIFIPYND